MNKINLKEILLKNIIWYNYDKENKFKENII